MSLLPFLSLLDLGFLCQPSLLVCVAQRIYTVSVTLQKEQHPPSSYKDLTHPTSPRRVLYSPKLSHRRRRMDTEAKAKVVASVWGAEFIQFLAALAVLPRSIWKKRLNSFQSSKSTEAKQLAQQGIVLKACPLCLCFCLHPSSMHPTQFSPLLCH